MLGPNFSDLEYPSCIKDFNNTLKHFGVERDLWREIFKNIIY